MNIGKPMTAEDVLPWAERVGDAMQFMSESSSARLVTTDVTATTILSIPIVSGYTYLFKWEGLARQTEGSGTVGDGGVYGGLVGFHLVAGTATIIGAAISLIDEEDNAGWDFAVAGSGNQAVWTVTGENSKTIGWRLNVELRRISH